MHGITLKMIVEDLVERRGWEDLASHVRIRCFRENPSIKSSLIYLRRTPWAREKVEEMYQRDHMRMRRRAARLARSQAKKNES